MGAPPNPEPFKALCIELGFLTAVQAEEVAQLQKHVAETLDLPQEYLETARQKKLLSDDQARKVAEEAKKRLAAQPRKIKELAGCEIIEKVGEGGMGAVYKARQRSLDRIVAVKVLPPRLAKNTLFVERFLREARASAALNHPNIVQGIDVGEDQGLHYFMMEFIDGETIGQRLKKEAKLPVADVLEIGRQTALALAHAHGKGLVHRDVKPDNLMYSRSGTSSGGYTIKVMDLGLARAVEDDASMTQSGTAVGTPFYIAPEQARGEKDIHPAADLYALGGTLYHLLTGRPPFEGETSAVIMAKHLTQPAPNPRELRPDLPHDLAAMVLKLLSKEPEERYPSAEVLAEDLERVLKGEHPEHVAGFKAKGRTLPGRTTGPSAAIKNRLPGAGGKSTGPLGVVSTKKVPVRTGETAGAAPVRPEPPKSAFPVVPVAVGGLVLVAVLGLAFSGKRTPPPPVAEERKPVSPPPAQQAVHKPVAPAPVVSPEKAPPPASAPVAVDTSQQQRLDELLREAKEAEAQEPKDLEKQQRLWTQLQTLAEGHEYRRMATGKLTDLQGPLKTAAEAAAAERMADAEAKAKAGQYDAALTALDLRTSFHDVQEKLATQKRETQAQGQAEGEKRLNAAAAQWEAGQKAEALKLYEAAGAFPYAPVSAEARKRHAALTASFQSEQAAAALAASKGFLALCAKVQGLVLERKSEEAQAELLRGLQDAALRSKADALKLLADGLRSAGDFYALITRRLAEKGGQGITLKSGIYLRCEGGQLYLKPSATSMGSTSRPLEKFEWPILLELSGLSDPAMAEKALQAVSVDKAPALGAFLALLGESQHARSLLARAKGSSDEALVARMANLETSMAALEAGALEAAAAGRLKTLDECVEGKRWKDAAEVFQELRTGKYAATETAKGQAVRLDAMTPKLRAGLIEWEIENLPIEKLFKGRAKKLADGNVELAWDFSDPAQLQDFNQSPNSFTIKDGRVSHGPGHLSLLWTRAQFEGDKLEVALEGDTPNELAVYMGPEMKWWDTNTMYSFRFSRRLGTITSPGRRTGSRIAEELKEKMPNRIVITRNGKVFTGQVNNTSAPGRYVDTTDKEAVLRNIGVGSSSDQTWFDNLKITGRLEAEWLKQAKAKAVAEMNLDFKWLDAPAPATPGRLRGKLTDLGGGKVKVEYDFSSPAQLEDFESHPRWPSAIQTGRLAPRTFAHHAASWRPPWTVAFSVWTSGRIPLLLASDAGPHSGKPWTRGIFLGQFGEMLNICKDNRSVCVSTYRQQPKGPMDMTVAFDGKTWTISCEGKNVANWTDPSPSPPETCNRMAFGGQEGQMYANVVIQGTLDPQWLASGGKRAESGEKSAHKEPDPQPAPATAPPPPQAIQPAPVNDAAAPAAPPGQPGAQAPADQEKSADKVAKTFVYMHEARLRWADAKVAIPINQKIRISVEGQWSSGNHKAPVSAAGAEPKVGLHPSMALLARAPGKGNRPESDIYVGEKWEGHWQGNKIMFQANDDPTGYSENMGALKITIEFLD